MSYAPKVYRKQGGNEMVVASGGKVTIDAGGKVVPNLTLSNITTAGAGTYTAAHIAGGLITRDPNGAARTDTTDTAVAIIAACDLSADGESATCHLINTADAAEVITLAGGAGVTVSNVGQTLAQNESAVLLFRRTSSSAVTLYILGA
jgi:hypothetical protein